MKSVIGVERVAVVLEPSGGQVTAAFSHFSRAVVGDRSETSMVKTSALV